MGQLVQRPSSAPRWMNCGGSAGLEAQFPDTQSEIAAEGTAEDTKGTPSASTDKTMNPVYTLKTGMGNIEVELFADKAPETVANFIGLAEGSKTFSDPKTGKNIWKQDGFQL